MKKLKYISCSILVLFSINLFAYEADIRGIELVQERDLINRLVVKVLGTLNDNPQITVNKNKVEIIIPKAHLANKFKKYFNGTLVAAEQTKKNSVLIKMVLPYGLDGKESAISTILKEGVVDISFPRNIVKNEAIKKNALSSSNIEAEKLDETYLSALVKESEAKENKEGKAKESEVKNELKSEKESQKIDRVSLAQSSTQKDATKVVEQKQNDAKSSFSLVGYIGKFIAFLSLLVLGFYFVLTLIKKGVIKKGKLGFLNSTKLIEVLNTTHIAPKRSLMMVKAHKQIFLIANSESGMQLISEITDVSGLIKSGEEELLGSNFDTNLYKAKASSKEFKMKKVEELEIETDENEDEDEVEIGGEDEYSLNSLLSGKNIEENKNVNKNVNKDVIKDAYKNAKTSAMKSIQKNPIKDQVKFSDQIRTKLKNMKQMQ